LKIIRRSKHADELHLWAIRIMARNLHLPSHEFIREGITNMFRGKFSLKLILLFFALALCLPITLAARTPKRQARADIPKNAEAQYDRAQSAADILSDLARTPDKGIPRSLLDRAYGIAVFPHVVKAAFGIGGRWGKGLVSVRRSHGWSAPAYVEITGGSFGFQIGGQATDLVLVFTTRRGVDSLLNSKVKLGADASVAAGPVGRAAEAGTDVKLNSEIYAYSRSKGLFGGISLNGAVVSFDNSANRRVYGMEGRQVIAGKGPSSPVTRPFLAALHEYSPKVIR
jgi:lipid-binding SYLF domain-containing protein